MHRLQEDWFLAPKRKKYLNDCYRNCLRIINHERIKKKTAIIILMKRPRRLRLVERVLQNWSRSSRSKIFIRIYDTKRSIISRMRFAHRPSMKKIRNISSRIMKCLSSTNILVVLCREEDFPKDCIRLSKRRKVSGSKENPKHWLPLRTRISSNSIINSAV